MERSVYAYYALDALCARARRPRGGGRHLADQRAGTPCCSVSACDASARLGAMPTGCTAATCNDDGTLTVNEPNCTFDFGQRPPDGKRHRVRPGKP